LNRTLKTVPFEKPWAVSMNTPLTLMLVTRSLVREKIPSWPIQTSLP
jgi:hypothetical protein